MKNLFVSAVRLWRTSFVLALFLPLGLQATPTIVSQPTDTTANAGDTASFSVSATGTGTLTYKWQLNGSGNYSSTSNLVINNVQDSQSGNVYTVIVTDSSHTSVTSHPATLTVKDPPVIQTQPLSEVVDVGGEATFSVSVNTLKTPTYQWQKNGTNIPGATMDSFDINPVADGDAGVYVVAITNSDGFAISSPAYLTIVEPQVVGSQSLALAINTCTNLTLSVITYGSDTNLSYQWYYSTNMTPVGSNSPQLVFPDVQFPDAGMYTVQVSTSDGDFDYASGSFSVTNPAPMITGCPSDIVVQTGPGATICGKVVSWTPPTASDNCSVTNFTSTHNPGDTFSVGTTLVTYTAVDDSNQMTQCSFNVTVQDTTPPVVVLNTIDIDLNSSGMYNLSPADIAAFTAGSSDNCGIASTNVSPTSFNCGTVGSNTVTVILTDINGNSATNTGIVRVHELIPPTVVANNINIYLDVSGHYTLTPSDVSAIAAGSTAVCGIASEIVTPSSFAYTTRGSNGVTLVVTDVNGNHSSAPAVVFVNDTNAPIPPNPPNIITVNLGANGTYALTTNDIAAIANGSSDAVGITSEVVTPNSFTCGNLGTNPVQLVLTDSYGNTTTQNTSIIVKDVIPPKPVFNSQSVQLDPSGNYTLTPADTNAISAGTSDNCTISSISISPATFTFCDVGTKTLTLTVTDESGNVAQTNGTVTVLAPVGQPAVVYVDTNYSGGCAAAPFPYNGGSGVYYIGYNAFPTIQAGLNAVTNGGTVIAAPEAFNESPVISQPVTLTSIGGTNSASTAIVLQTNAPQYLKGISIGASGVTLEGFTIVGFDAVGNGLASSDIIFPQQGVSNVVIANNIIEVGSTGPKTDYDDGLGIIDYYNTASPLINNVVVTGNSFIQVDATPANETPGAAFYMNPMGSFTFESNNLTGDLSSSISSATNTLIAYNTVTGTATNDTSGAFGTWGYPDPTVYGHATIMNNVISNVGTAIALYDSEDVTIANNLVNGNGTALVIEDTGYSPPYNAGTTVQIVNNSFAGDSAGIINTSSNSTPVASSNWWGSVSGPASLSANPYGTGSSVSGNLSIVPWLNNGSNSTANGFAPASPAFAYPPVQLAFTTEPAGANLGSLLSVEPVVQLEDTNGNVTPWANPSVTLVLGNDTTGAILTGSNPLPATNGIATFTDLAVTRSGGSNLVLVASAPYLPSLTSTAFNVTNPAPVISNIVPYYARNGGGNVTLTVNGSDFAGDSTVYWNGMALATTFVSANQLVAIIPSSDIANVGVANITVGSPGPGGGVTAQLPFQIETAVPPVVYVDARYTGLAASTRVDWPYDTNSGPHIIGYDAFATIQGGVSAVAASGTVNVAIGTYPEVVVVSNSMSILGAQAGQNANSRFASFVSGANGPKADPTVETVVTAVSDNPDGATNDSFHIMASNVTIDGLVLDGNNPTLNQNNATMVGGINADSGDAIKTEDGAGNFVSVNNAILKNNIIQNYSHRGIELLNPTDLSIPTTGNLIQGNVVQNFGGDGILLAYNAYGDIISNTVVMAANGESGIWMQDSPHSGATPKTLNWSHNIVTVCQDAFAGIWANLIYGSNVTFNIHDNTVNAAVGVTGSDDYTYGIYLSSLENGAAAQVSNNIVGASGGQFARGIVVWNDTGASPATVTGGSVGNAVVGISLSYYDENFGSADASSSVNVSAVSISGTGVGILADNTYATSSRLSLQVSGNTAITSSGTGVSVLGSNTLANIHDNSASITGNGVGVSVNAGVAFLQNNDLSGSTLADLSVTNGAIVDAGNCTGVNVTGLGISSGGNNLSGSGFNNAAPWAVINGNSGGSPAVLADHDNFGAGLGNNIASAVQGNVLYTQTPAVLGAPTNLFLGCVSSIPAGATNLAGLFAQSGYYSGNHATVAFSDDTNFTGSGVVHRTYTVTDGCGVVSTATQTITVSDTTPPVFTYVPANMTYPADLGQCSKTNVTWTVTATDDCALQGIVSMPPSGSTFPHGTTTVTNIATDTSGNQTVATFTITIIDTQPPTIAQCATNMTIDADATGHASLPDLRGEVVAMDNCGSVTISQIPAPSTVVNLGPTTVTLWASDPSGNSNSCTATVTVKDVTPPMVTCPPDVTVTVLQDKDPYATGTAMATDAGAAQEHQPIAISYVDNDAGLTNCDGTGQILRTWIAMDPSGNTNSCVQTITVIDNIAPNFKFVPASIVTTNDPGNCSAVVTYATARASDLEYLQDFADTNWVSSTNQQSLDWSDGNSHVSQVPSGTGGIAGLNGAAYAVIDSTVPQAGPAYSQSGAYTHLGGFSSHEYDNFGYGTSYSTPFGLGYHVALDVYLNLNDPAVVNATTSNGYGWDLSTSASALAGQFLRDFIFHTAAYNSNGIVIAADNQSNDSPDARRNDLLTLANHAVITNSGWYKFEWDFRNTNGVLAVDLKVRDTNNAVLFSQTLSDPGDSIANVDGRPNYTWFVFVFADKLPIANSAFEHYVPVNSVPASGSTFVVGTTTVTNTSMDSCGNTTNTTFTVTVNDVEPPFIPVLAGVTQANDHGNCSAVVNFTLPTNSITDNCGLASIVATPPSGSTFAVGTNLVTVVVTDIHSNSSTNTFNVIVNDTEPPSANVPANIVQANDHGQCGAIVSFTIPAQTDNCGIASSNATPPSGSLFPVGTTPVTVVVGDIHGNFATNTFTVTVNDTEQPMVYCPSNIVQGVDPGQSYATVSFTPTATDNCGSPNIVATPSSGSHFNVGTNTVNVVATDIHGNTSSCSFTVQVVALPQITQQPASRTNNQGTTATFTVVASSPTPLGYQWMKNGANLGDGGNISGSTTATLTVSNVMDADVAAYSVTVSNIAGTVLSSNANLTVIDPPVIATQPVSITNNATTTATFTVLVTGTAPFGFHWYKNGTNQLSDGGNVSGSLTNVLVLSNVLAADRGLYSVTITNPAGTVTSSNAQLSVIDPWISSQPVNTTQPLGGSASFSVVGVGTAPLLYQWQQNGSAIPGATNSSYNIAVIQDSDAGSYNVTVTSVGGNMTSSNATLTVTHPPVFVTQPQSQTIILGQHVTFNVNMNGTTPFTYQWQKNETNIPGATSHSFTINSVTTNDAGTYDVFVTNPDGNATSTNAVLTVIVPPSIVSQPSSVTNNAGTTATFTVVAQGTSPVYQWYENSTNKLVDGGNISGSATPQLTLSNVFGADAGSYSVVITNLGGSLTSSNAVLTVIDPVITNEPMSLTVVRGSPASFSVGVTATSPAYQWRKNGTAISGATQSSFAIASAADSDAASYDVVITNIYGSVTSAPPAVLTVLDPPVITQQPVSRTNNAGTTATFSVIANGTAPLGYQWYKGAAPLSNGGNISGATSATLVISSVADGDVAAYSVVVTNAVGTNTSSSVSLTVIDPPVIIAQPASRTNDAGSTATFTVGLTGTPPFTYQWMKNSTNLSDGGNISGSQTATLTISGVSFPDQASYSVMVSNPAGTTNSATASLTVIAPPTISAEPVSLTNNAGTTATFSVTAMGSAPLAYQWKKNLANLTDGGNISGSTTATLVISSVSDSDVASYSVTITNLAGATNSTGASLTVIDPPVITSGPLTLSNNAGTTATFSVTVTGTAPLSYQWYKNVTNKLANGGNVSGATSGVLTLSNVFGADRGEYSVVVTNVAGTATSTNAALGVVDPYISLQPTNVTAIDGSTASFAVSVVGTGPLTYQWRQNDADIYDGFGITGTGTSTLVISNVTDSDAGNYSVVVTNSQGTATSVEALLTTILPLTISELTNQYVIVGEAFNFTVNANGNGTLTYQWSQNGTNLSGATTRIYSSTATSTSGGLYKVTVNDQAGLQTNASAMLFVYSNAIPQVFLTGYTNGDATLLLRGVPTYSYALQASTNLETWVTITTNVSPFSFTDTNTFKMRFYRGLYLP